jgi:hypothetical protein
LLYLASRRGNPVHILNGRRAEPSRTIRPNRRNSMPWVRARGMVVSVNIFNAQKCERNHRRVEWTAVVLTE